MLRHDALKAHVAGGTKQVWSDLALFEVIEDDAIDAPPQHLGQMVLSEVQRQRPEIVALAHQDVERIELDLLVVLAAVQAVEIGDPSAQSSMASPSRTNEFGRLRSAASTMRGYRLLQS